MKRSLGQGMGDGHRASMLFSDMPFFPHLHVFTNLGAHGVSYKGTNPIMRPIHLPKPSYYLHFGG